MRLTPFAPFLVVAALFAGGLTPGDGATSRVVWAPWADAWWAWDKLAHAVGFGAFAASLVLARGWRGPHAVAVAVAAGVMLEALQAVLPGRTVSTADALANGVGAVVAVLFVRATVGGTPTRGRAAAGSRSGGRVFTGRRARRDRG